MKLIGAGDASELRATGGSQTYPVQSWSVEPDGFITLNLGSTRDFVGGSPVTVEGLRGLECSGDPNGPQIAEGVTATSLRFRPKGARCSAGSGRSGNVTNRFPVSAVLMEGKGTELRNVKITTTWQGTRTGLHYSSAILNQAAGFVVDHVHIIGSAAMGYQCIGCSHGTESNNIVERTNADGMEHDGCASYITSTNNQTFDTGDDSFSVNSYQHDSCVTHDISFTNDHSTNGRARGFETDSGENITFTGGTITNAKQSCLYFHAGSGGYAMQSLNNIKVSGVTLNGCGGSAIWISSSGGGPYQATSIQIDHVSATGVAKEAIHVGEPGGETNTVRITNCSIKGYGSGAPPPAIVLARGRGVVLNGVNFSGFGQKCIALRPGGRPEEIAPSGVTCDGNRISRASEAVR